MSAKLVSIQGERQVIPLAYVKCRAFQKHDLDGIVVKETVNRRKVWIARLQCNSCGTHRIDVMKPKTTQLLSRAYIHPDDYDGSLSTADARRILYKHMLDNGVSLSSLAG